MTNLSPEAQAVLKAVQATLPDYMLTDRTAGYFAAAALRAAADDVVPIEYELIDDYYGYEKKNPIREQLLDIAKELKAL